MKFRSLLSLGLSAALILSSLSCSEIVVVEADNGASSADGSTADSADSQTPPDTSQGDTILGAGCCAYDNDCEAGSVCANSAPGDLEGMCSPAPESNSECYNDSHCPDGENCVGAALCPCTTPCFAPPSLGTCQGGTEPDTTTPQDVGSSSDAEDDILSLPDQGASDTGPPQSDCCTMDSDCPQGSQCANTVCKENPPFGMCWDQEDCPQGTHECQAAVVCSCEEDCGFTDQPGLCVNISTPKKELNECCDPLLPVDPCDEGLVCYSDWAINPNVGTCLVIPTGGQCYSPNECGGNACKNGVFCSCDMNCVSTLGNCLIPDGCCGTDEQCNAGQSCAVPDGETSGQCGPGLQSGECYTDSDCPQGLPCQGESLCPCGAMCFAPITPGTCGTTNNPSN